MQLRSAQALGGRDVAQLQRRAPPLDKQNRNYMPKRDNGSRHRGRVGAALHHYLDCVSLKVSKRRGIIQGTTERGT